MLLYFLLTDNITLHTAKSSTHFHVILVDLLELILFLFTFQVYAWIGCIFSGFTHDGDQFVPKECILIVDLILKWLILPIDIGFFIFVILGCLELSQSDFAIWFVLEQLSLSIDCLEVLDVLHAIALDLSYFDDIAFICIIDNSSHNNKFIKHLHQPNWEKELYLNPGVESLFLSSKPSLFDLGNGCPIDFLNFDRIDTPKHSLFSSIVKEIVTLSRTNLRLPQLRTITTIRTWTVIFRYQWISTLISFCT